MEPIAVYLSARRKLKGGTCRRVRLSVPMRGSEAIIFDPLSRTVLRNEVRTADRQAE